MEGDSDSVVSWTPSVASSPSSVVHWTPSSEKSVVCWSDSESDSPTPQSIGNGNCPVASTTPTRKQRISLPSQLLSRQPQASTPIATAIKKKINFPVDHDSAKGIISISGYS